MSREQRAVTRFGLQLPHNWETLEDGVYGDVEAFIEELDAGRVQDWYEILKERHKLDDTKVLIWIKGLCYVESGV